MKEKPIIIGFPVVPFNQSKHSDVYQYLQYVQDLLIDIYKPEVEFQRFLWHISNNYNIKKYIACFSFLHSQIPLPTVSNVCQLHFVRIIIITGL